jgi:hypothetical protein
MLVYVRSTINGNETDVIRDCGRGMERCECMYVHMHVCMYTQSLVPAGVAGVELNAIGDRAIAHVPRWYAEAFLHSYIHTYIHTYTQMQMHAIHTSTHTNVHTHSPWCQPAFLVYN